VREITDIIVHCSASDNPKHHDISVIKKWHLERGFKDIGYHYVITKTAIQKGRWEKVIGAHCKGHNKHSIGICLCGDKKFSDNQFELAAHLIGSILRKYNIPKYKVRGHNYYDPKKTCPNFDVDKIKTRITCW